MAETGVKFFAVGQIDGQLVLSVSLEKNFEVNFTQEASLYPLNKKKYKQEAQSLLSKLKGLNLKPEERQKIKASNGSWYCTVDKNGLGYMVSCPTEFAERYAYQLIGDIQKSLSSQIPNYWENHKQSEVSNKGPALVQSLISRYNDLEANDTLSKTQSTLNQVKETTTNSVRQILDNTGSLEILQDKSQKMKLLSEQVSRDAALANEMMRKKRRRLMITIFVVVIALIIFIYFAF